MCETCEPVIKYSVIDLFHFHWKIIVITTMVSTGVPLSWVQVRSTYYYNYNGTWTG